MSIFSSTKEVVTLCHIVPFGSGTDNCTFALSHFCCGYTELHITTGGWRYGVLAIWHPVWIASQNYQWRELSRTGLEDEGDTGAAIKLHPHECVFVGVSVFAVDGVHRPAAFDEQTHEV